MRKNAEGTRVDSRQARRFNVAPVTRAIRAALAVSAATLAFGSSANAFAAAETHTGAPARNEAAQRDAIGAPVLDLTLAGGPAPSSVISGHGTGLPEMAPRDFALAAPDAGNSLANHAGDFEGVDDPTIPAANFYYTNNGAILDNQVGNPAFGIYGDAGTDDAFVVNNGSIEVYSALNIADGIFVGGNDIGVSNYLGATIDADGAGFAAGIEAEGTGSVNIGNAGAITVYAYGSMATGYGIHASGDIVNVNNTGSIDVTGEMPTGILAAGGTSATVFNNGTIVSGTELGSYAGTGILVSTLYDGSYARVINYDSGSIVASGYYGATGIEVRASGVDSSGRVYNSGSVTATQYSKYGNGAAGIVVSSEGDAFVTNSGLIDVQSGGLADGIIALAFNGDASVSNSGDIEVSSTDALKYYAATGITAASQYGTASVNNSGSITVDSTKYNAFGVVAQGAAGASVYNNGGTIDVVGYNAYGIVASSSGGNVGVFQSATGTISVGTTAVTATAIGIAGIADVGNVSVYANGDIDTASYGLSVGIYANAAAGSANVFVGGNVDAISDGGNAFGVAAFGAGAVTVNNQGSIYANSVGGTATGILANGGTTVVSNGGPVMAVSTGDATGIRAVGTDSATVISSGAIDVTAYGDAFGIYAISAGDVYVNTSSTLIVQSVAGMAIGIFGYSTGGDVTIRSAADIDVYSEYGIADGIFASGANLSVSNEGNIVVDGANWAAGIEAQGTGTTNVSNNGDITVQVHFDTANEYYGYHNAFGIFATGDIVNIGNGGTIDVTGDVASGIYAVGGNAVSIYNSGDITSGTLLNSYSGVGIFASSLYDGSTVSVYSTGNITVAGYTGAVGIEAHSTGVGSNASVNSSGDIIAGQYAKYGSGAAGIVVTSEGSASVNNSGAITVDSYGQADGIIALAFNGNASVTNSGDIDVLSDGSILYYSANGITAASQLGQAFVNNTGTVNVASTKYGGYLATGITASGGANATVYNSGSITVQAKYANGIVATSSNGDVRVYNSGTGTITVGDATGSTAAYGIVGIASTGNVSIGNAGAVDVNAYGFALGVYGGAAVGDVGVQNSGDITVYSYLDAAIGIAAISGGDTFVANSGLVDVNGFTSAVGILAQGDVVYVANSGTVVSFSYGNTTGIRAVGTGSVNVNGNGDISAISVGTTAGTAFGIYAISDGDVSVGFGGNMTVQSIADSAIGIFGLSTAADVSLNNSGAIDVYSEYGLADGMFASGLNVNVGNSGGITVDGTDWAAGIEAQGTGNTSVTNLGDIAVNVHFDTANEYYGYHNAFGIFATGDFVSIYNNGTIGVTGDMAHGIYAIGGSSALVTNNGDITSGTLLNSYAGAGIFVASLYDGSVANVGNSGNIVVEGYFGAVGIEVRAAGVGSSASVYSSGSISASQYSKYGNGAAGIVVTSEGAASVNNTGTISVDSDGQADGIIAFAFNGNSTVYNSGSIDVLSDNASLYYSATGITAASQFGQATVNNSGSISAASTKYGGYIATGIIASGATGASVTNSGDITAQAKYAYGIVATSADGSVVVNNTDTGAIVAGTALDAVNAYGIIGVSSNASTWISNAGSIDVASYSDALGIYAGAANGGATVYNSGSVGVYSYTGGAVGIAAIGENASVNNSGTVDANGLLDTTGILAVGDTVSVYNSGAVVSHSYADAFGIRAQGATSVNVSGDGDITVATVGTTAGAAYGIHAVSPGNVSVGFGGDMYVDSVADLAIGIFALSSAADVYVNNSGLIDVYSDGALADGIFASGTNVGVTSSGGIVVDGNGWAAGIEAQGIDQTSVTNSGDIDVNVHFDTGYYGEHNAFGIFATAEQVGISNTGSVTVTGDLANGIYAVGGSWVSISNDGDVAAGELTFVGTNIYGTYAAVGIFGASLYDGSATSIGSTGSVSAIGYAGATGIEARASGVGSYASVNNSGSVYASAYSKYGAGGSGIVVASEGSANAINSGSIEVIAGGLANGILAIAFDGNSTVTNSGDIDVLSNAASKYYGAYGITAVSQNGYAVVNNSGSIDAASTKYGGYIAMGIVASGGDGVAVTNSGAISALANNGYGIVGTSVDGDVSITQTAAGTISVLNEYGSYSIGVLGLSTNGSVSVNNGGGIALDAYYGSIGVFARSTNGDVSVTSSGDIDGTALVRSIGILASAANGTVTVNNSGDIYAGAAAYNEYYYTRAIGIDARGDIVNVVNSGNITATSYDDAFGALIVGTGDVIVQNSGDIAANTTFGTAMGLYAGTDANLNIATSGSINAQSDLGSAAGVFTSAAGDLAFNNSGSIAATSGAASVGDAATGVSLFALNDVFGNNSGSILATSTDGASVVGLQIFANGDVSFLNTGTIGAVHDSYATAVYLDSSFARFENTGTVSTTTGSLEGQVAVRGGDGVQVIVNRGDIIGALILGGGTDIFAGYNGGEWLVNNHITDFGGGNDRIYNFAGSTIHLQDGSIDLGAGSTNMFENNGTIRVSGTASIHMGNGLPLPVGPDVPAAVPSLNSLAFINDGLINFVDGAPDDVLTVTGDFSGDGAINIDIGVLAGLGDLLYIDGSVVNGGSQTVNVEFDGRITDLLDPVTFAFVTGNTNANAFVAGQAIGSESDFLDYDLVVTSAVAAGTTEYMLGVDVTGLNDAGSLAASVAPGAHSLINSHVGTWRQRMGVTPDKGGERHGLGPWVRVYRDSGTVDVDHTESFGPGGHYRFDQSNDGTEVGFNFDTGFGLSYGVMVGSGDATQDLLGGGIGRDRFDLHSAGVYATWIGERFYFDASWRTMDFDARLTTPGGVMTTSGNATARNLEAGWTGLEFAGIDVVPQLQYTYVTLDDIDDVEGTNSSFEIDGGASERLRAGVAFSKTFTGGPVIWTPFASLNAIREMQGDNRYIVADNFDGATSTDGTSAMVELGIGAQIHGWSVTAGANWTDGGAQESFVGGQMILRYTW